MNLWNFLPTLVFPGGVDQQHFKWNINNIKLFYTTLPEPTISYMTQTCYFKIILIIIFYQNFMLICSILAISFISEKVILLNSLRIKFIGLGALEKVMGTASKKNVG